MFLISDIYEQITNIVRSMLVIDNAQTLFFFFFFFLEPQTFFFGQNWVESRNFDSHVTLTLAENQGFTAKFTAFSLPLSLSQVLLCKPSYLDARIIAIRFA